MAWKAVDLFAASEAIIATMVGEIPQAHQEFLIGFLEGAPEWELLGLAGADALPAVRWRQQNLDKLDAD